MHMELALNKEQCQRGIEIILHSKSHYGFFFRVIFQS